MTRSRSYEKGWMIFHLPSSLGLRCNWHMYAACCKKVSNWIRNWASSLHPVSFMPTTVLMSKTTRIQRFPCITDFDLIQWNVDLRCPHLGYGRNNQSIWFTKHELEAVCCVRKCSFENKGNCLTNRCKIKGAGFVLWWNSQLPAMWHGFY